MLSLPEDWDYTLSGLAYICKDGIDSVRAGVSELEKAHYLTKSRVRNEKGQLTETEYTIFEMPQPKLEKLKLENPILDIPTLANPILAKPTLDNPTQLNTKQQIKEKQRTDFTNQSIHQPGRMDKIDADTYRRIVYENIDYEIICEQYDRERLDEIVEIMLECICSARPAIRIAGEQIPCEIVRSRYLKINSEHISYVMDCMDKNTSKVRNIKEYLKTVLYNAPVTISNYYTALVNHDLCGRQGGK